MSKLSFRARALDATKPLPVYHAQDLPDLLDYNAINRTVPQMPTGMEKEEESERHLQDVILAKQTSALKKKHVYIPTPEAAIPVSHYESMSTKIDRASQYVRVPGLGLDEVPDYDLDSEDEEWLNAQTNERPLSPTHFERMMDKLEKGSGNTVLSEREAQGLLRDDENLVLAVYDYWLAKRLRLGRALIPMVKHEGRDGGPGSGSNPYLAFRKRTEKMQTRKNRKNDEMAYMQMFKLKRDLEKAVSLTQLVKEREQKKHALVQTWVDVFKTRYLLEDWSGSILSSLNPVSSKAVASRQDSCITDSGWETKRRIIKVEANGDYDVHRLGRHEVIVPTGLKRKRRKKYYYTDVHSETPITPSTPNKIQRDSSHDLSSDRLEDEESEGIFSFKRKPHVHYHSCRDPLSVWPWSNEDILSSSVKDSPTDNDMMIMDYSPYSVLNKSRPNCLQRQRKYRHSQSTLSGHFIGLSRRRLGRGGRVMWDRATSQRAAVTSTGTSLPDGLPTTMFPDVSGENKGENEDSVEMTPLPMNRGVEQCGGDLVCPHFHPQSPPPTLTFNPPHLPLIELGHSEDTSSMSNQHSTLSSFAPFSGISLAFRGMNSEFHEEAKTFFSLPTSQFFLKSSSPELDYQKLLLGTESSWGLHHIDLRQNVFKRTTSDYSNSSINSPLHTLATPTNNPLINPLNEPSIPSVDRSRSTQQVMTKSEQSTPKELSRSSLSVADSKTIVLSNVPHPKHQTEKSQKTAQNEKSTKDSTEPPAQGVPDKLHPLSLQKDKSTISSTSSRDKLVSAIAQTNDSAFTTPHPNSKETSDKDDSSSDAKKINTLTPLGTKPTAAQTSDSNSAPVSDTKENVASSLAESAAKKTPPNHSLTMITPASNVLEFDTPPWKKYRKTAPDNKTISLISLDAANLITSQLGQEHVIGKKEVLGIVGVSQNTGVSQHPSTVHSSNDILKSGITTNTINSVSALTATKLAEIQSSLLNIHDKTSAVTIPVANSGSGGHVDGRTAIVVSNLANSSTIAHKVASTGGLNQVGQALSTMTSAVAHRASPGTNGTNNYQDIFHTATRRISESTERGLKQALAGMNHSSLMETANSLVQLGNSSEVT